jgi:nucleotide-binding universal stress UspA family protein
VPEHLIVELAENYGCDAIVMGARGMGDPDAGGLGPVAQAVLDSATLPVVVVRTAADGVQDAAPDEA